jgi:acyl-CoA synthetase (AMP-forming)/AMP-acid ligase II
MKHDDWNRWKSLNTIVEVLRVRAEEEGASVPYVFLKHQAGDEPIEQALTFGDLDRRARAAAAELQLRTTPGMPALLLYPPGLDFIVGFYAALYAGLLAIPTYPPDPFRLERTVPRLKAMVEDANAAIIISDTSIHSLRSEIVQYSAQLGELPWVRTDVELRDHEEWIDPHRDRTAPAILQYTSGSTGSPKGVMLTHSNVLEYLFSLSKSDPESTLPEKRGVMWLPTYHDLGLVQGVLFPICLRQHPFVLMSPLDFLQRPIRWLNAVSRYKATLSGGPNFAFELCANKITKQQAETLSLENWEIAFCGAEQVRQSTLDKFAAAFQSSGFKPNAFRPGYGLAEATLAVTLGPRSEPPTVRHLDRKSLEAGIVDEHGTATTAIVGCGYPVKGVQVKIVDPSRLQVCANNQIGEIWISGQSMATEYWNNPLATAARLQASLPGSNEGPFVRTGDLGFLDKAGELFITGRIKDLLIIRGRNIYPQDIELAAESGHKALRPGAGAAFSYEVENEEVAGLIYEIRASTKTEELSSILSAVRAAVANDIGLQLNAIALIPEHCIYKTSSGKLQRHACKAAFLTGELRTIAKWESPNTEKARALAIA